ncbi:MAG: DUF4870 domain-containing protein [Puniceicoccaceae bacterium]|nr:MAG: DUF4870 domain-containing protein [Puniceicoccaceae bacterium]
MTTENQPPPPAPTEPPPAPAPSSNKDERTFAMLAHLIALVGFIIPLGSIIGPLVIWLIKKESMPLVDDQGKESINFQITIFIAVLVCLLLAFVGIGFILLPVVGILWLVFVILAAIKANEGVAYRYPFNIRFIK